MSVAKVAIARIYPHRKNFDGTWDAVCPICCKTIARAELEASLSELEADHFCTPKATP